MKYTGRIVGIVAVIIFAVGIEIDENYGFEYAFWHIPITILILLYIACRLGLKYDYYVFTATKDILTKVYNRHYVVENFDKILNKALKSNKTIGVFIIDCNNFKYVNDKYGHIEGDKALKKLAEILEQNKEPDDIVARWGGDEFLIIKAVTTDKRYKKRITVLNTKLKFVSLSLKTELSVSVGYYKCSRKILLDEAIALADEMMYEQKALRKLNMMDSYI